MTFKDLQTYLINTDARFIIHTTNASVYPLRFFLNVTLNTFKKRSNRYNIKLQSGNRLTITINHANYVYLIIDNQFHTERCNVYGDDVCRMVCGDMQSVGYDPQLIEQQYKCGKFTYSEYMFLTDNDTAKILNKYDDEIIEDINSIFS